VSLRQAIFSDLHRHPGFLDISFLRKRSSEVVTSRPVFWTLTPELNIASALQERCPGDCFKPSDKLSLHPNVRFFTSGRQFAKVYSFLWPIRSGDAALLASALHEAAATIAVCSKRPKWDYKVFGVVSQGAYASYVHICICRNVLLPQKVDSQAAIKKYMKLFRKTGIVHGDCHINNILKGANGAIEAFDFERCFIPLASVSNSTIEDTNLSPASNVFPSPSPPTRPAQHSLRLSLYFFLLNTFFLQKKICPPPTHSPLQVA
jgi:hypothetical protein